ncbi:hypothetical protein AgCh_036317 [Apium graveolens]
MDETITANNQPSIFQRPLSAVVPMLLVAISYIDPGKWVAAVDGGARYECNTVLVMLVLNLAAILCQYLSARIAVVTGKDLAQICSEEYGKVTCILLGVQSELSMIVLDLTMILGIAHGLNLVLGVDLFTCLILTSTDAILFPFFSSFLQQRGGRCISKETECHDHLFSVVCIFSGIFLVNYLLVHSAANALYSADLLLTYYDVLSLTDQEFMELVLPFALTVILIFSNHITALSWKLGRQAVLHTLFKVSFPGWLHHSVIRLIAIVPALYCVRNSGAEGTYQLMHFTQIVVAFLLPSSVILLYRVSTSSSVMGVHKISVPVEFLVFSTFVGMLGIEIVFVAELIFGSSDWVTNMQWNMWSDISIIYIILISTASFSLCLIFLLATNPLSYATSSFDVQTCNLDVQSSMPGFSKERVQHGFLNDTGYRADELIQKQEPVTESDGNDLLVSASTSTLGSDSFLDSESRPQLISVKEKCSVISYTTASICNIKDSESRDDIAPESISCKEISGGEPVHDTTLTTKKLDLPVCTLNAEVYLQTQKDGGGDTLDPEELSKPLSGNSPSLTSEGPGSYRSLSGKADDVGSGAGSFSRLAGLGRAARRQLAVVLDEFWGQLFDFHGKATAEAKSNRLDTLFGVDSKVDLKQSCVSPKVDNFRSEFTRNVPYSGERISNAFTSSSLYKFPVQQSGQSNVTYGVQSDFSSLQSSNTQLLDTYMQNSSYHDVDSSERRYSSMRLPPSTDIYNDQPATVHGYQMAYLSRIAKERNNGYLTSQMDLLSPKSPSVAYRDPFSVAAGQKPRVAPSSKTPPGFPSVPISRTSTLQPGRPFQGISPGLSADTVGTAVNEKKYHSLPDISGLSLPYRKSLHSGMGVSYDNTTMYRPSMSYTMQEAALYPNPLSKVHLSPSSTTGGATIYVDNFPSKVGRDAYSLQISSSSHTGSLWSRQPSEQFGVSGRARQIEVEGTRNSQSSIIQETPSVVGFEENILQSFRICIQKLLKLEGSDWLFRQNDGADEDLIDRVGARERVLYEAELRMCVGESHLPVEKKPGLAPKNEEMASLPQCGEGCIWRVDLIISFGVWCIHRVLELSLLESRPELWGKYTYVLNRLQGIIDLAFSKPRSPMTPCLCLQIPSTHEQSPPRILYGSLPPPAKQARGKSTTAAMLLEMVKDVEIAISCRKGRTGTAAGDVAFPKGKENLASVLKRYKRRLISQPVPSHDIRPG